MSICSYDSPVSRCVIALVQIVLGLAFLFTPVPSACAQPLAEKKLEVTLNCEITYHSIDGFFVNNGKDEGLTKGQVGRIQWRSADFGEFEVISASSDSACLRIQMNNLEAEEIPEPGNRIALLFEKAKEADVNNSLKKEPGASIKFQPLLSPYNGKLGKTESSSVVHGRLSLFFNYQTTTDQEQDYQRTHLRSSGSAERLDGTAWSLEWGGQLSYRAGDALKEVDDYKELRPEIYSFNFSRRFDGHGRMNWGRFLPRELPEVGYVDGIQGEFHTDSGKRFGAIAGFKPTRDDLDLSTREMLLASYYSLGKATNEKQSYQANIGFLATLYNGDPDRFALILSQNASWGKLRLLNNTTVDLDVGAAEVNDGPRLTNLDLSMYYPLQSTILRAGVDRYERPDTAAERDLVEEIALEDTEYFHDSRNRIFVGALHKLSPTWTIDEDVAYIDSNSYEGLRWSIGLTRKNIGSANSSLSFRLYNLDSELQSGLGCHLLGNIRVSNNGLSLQPSITVRVAEFETGNEQLEFFEAGLRANWRLTRKWSLRSGVSYAHADDDDRFRFDIGITLRW